MGVGRPASHCGPATVIKLVTWAVTRGQSLICQSREGSRCGVVRPHCQWMPAACRAPERLLCLSGEARFSLDCGGVGVCGRKQRLATVHF